MGIEGSEFLGVPPCISPEDFALGGSCASRNEEAETGQRSANVRFANGIYHVEFIRCLISWLMMVYDLYQGLSLII